MEAEKIYPFVYLIVVSALLIGAGALFVDKIGETAFRTTTIDNESMTWSNFTTLVLAHGNLTTITSVTYELNSTLIPTSDYSYTLENGTIFMNTNTSIHNGNISVVTYTYKEFNTAAFKTSKDAATEIGNISTNWLGLIITFGILAILIVMIVKGLNPRSR